MRKFGMIRSTLWRSRRFRSLTTSEAKLLYIFLHSYEGGNSAGCFHMSPIAASAFLREMDATTIEGAFDELAEVRLIRYDDEESIVQLPKFFAQNAPSSRKNVDSPIEILCELPPCSPVDHAAAEYFVAVWRVQREWRQRIRKKNFRSEKDQEQLADAAAHFLESLETLTARIPNLIDLLPDLIEELLPQDRAAFAEDASEIGLSVGLSIPLAIHRDLKPKKEIEQTGEHTGEHTSEQTREQRGEGLRGEGRSPDPETSAAIAELTRKAREAKR